MLRCTAIVAVVVAPYLEGCATGAAPREIGWNSASMVVAVTISNTTTRPVRLYLRLSSVDVELGTVQGLASRTFEVDSRIMAGASELQLEARDRRGGAVRSDTFTFGTKRVVWQVGYRSTPLDVR